MENRPKIRVTPAAYAEIKRLAKEGNRSMTGQVTEILALVTHPENGVDVIQGLAVVTRDFTDVTNGESDKNFDEMVVENDCDIEPDERSEVRANL
jgi:hypothetical protein